MGSDDSKEISANDDAFAILSEMLTGPDIDPVTSLTLIAA